MAEERRTELSRKGANGYKGPRWLARLISGRKWKD